MAKFQPILLYGSEIWGTMYRHNTEKTNPSLANLVLGVGYHSSNEAVLAKCQL